MDKKKSNLFKSKEKDKKNQVILFDIPVRDDMTDFEVEEQFSKLMDEMNLFMEKREPLTSRSIEDKRKILAQIQTTSETNPSSYADGLVHILERHFPLDKVIMKLDSLRVYLNNSPLSLVKEFNNDANMGLNKLISVFDNYIDNSEIALYCLKCVRAFGNCGYGLLTLINNKETLLHVALCLNPNHPNLMYLALELLTIFTFYSFEGHCNVMEALFIASQLRKCKERFLPIIKGLEAGIHNKQNNLLIPCLQFINVIVNPNFNDTRICSNLDLYYRMHLRIEFVRCGLNTHFDFLSSHNDDNIRQYILDFQADSDEEDDFNSKVELVKLCLKDRDVVYQVLNRSVCQTNCDPYLTSIFKHLLIIKDNPIRYNLYRLIDDVISELILHSDGICPDPTLNQLDSYNLTDLFEKFNDASNLHSSFDQQEKMNKILQEKYETEAKLFSLETKVGVKASDVSSPFGDQPSSPSPIQSVSSTSNDAVTLQSIVSPPPPPPPGVAPPPLKGNLLNTSEPVYPFGMKVKNLLKPKGPMKKANWMKVDVKLLDRNCIWKRIYDDDMNVIDILKELDDKFCTKTLKPKDQVDDNTSLNSYSGQMKKVKEFKVLDVKSGQNLAILSGSLKVTPEEIKRRILELDEGLLTQTNVENLLKNLPAPEQLNQLAHMKDDYENLNEAEQFGCTLSTILRLHPRLNSLLFKMKFNERVSDIKPAIFCATQALNEIRNSSNFIKILELVLMFGNFMNTSSKNSQTVGFQLNFLGKLCDTKDIQNESTLMEFLVHQVRNRFPFILNIISEFSYLDKAARVSSESINSTISEMKSIKINLEKELKLYKSQSNNDNYLPVMQEFLVCINEQLTLISELNTVLQLTYKDMGKYLSFDIKKYPMEDFFHDIKLFKDNFQKANKDLDMAIQIEFKRQKAREEQLRKEFEKSERQKHQAKATREEDSKVLDNLLETLKSGDAFGNRGDVRKRRPKKNEKIHLVNRSRSRRDFNKDLILSDLN